MSIQLHEILEAALFAATEAMNLADLQNIFLDKERPAKNQIKQALVSIEKEYTKKPIELVETASGYRFQVKKEFSPWVSRIWQEKPAKYSRALLETLAVIAYQQPTTRGEIEEIRGVGVSTHIIRSLEEREWIRIVGFKEVPGKPALYATTRQFLDYFNLQKLADLPTLSELQEIGELPDGMLPLQFDTNNENKQMILLNDEKATTE